METMGSEKSNTHLGSAATQGCFNGKCHGAIMQHYSIIADRL